MPASTDPVSLRPLSPVVLAGLAIAFLALCGVYWHFTMDDSFISFRYASHLAHGHGIVWNVGEDPVEGFTSFLWVVLNAAAILLGLSPVLFSKVFGVLATVGVLGLLWRASRRTDPTVTLVALSAIALSPPFALLSIQGMETSLAGLLLLALSLATLQVHDRPTRGAMLRWYSAAFVAALCRPDSIVFSAGAFAGVAGYLVHRRDGTALRSLGLLGAAFAGLGGVYLAWRVEYFGYLFPNPYYIKGHDETGLFQTSGARYLGSFLVEVALPYLVALVTLVLVRFDRERFLRTVPLLVGALLFTAYISTIDPIQGYAWRFLFPVVPALAFVALVWFRDAQFPRTVSWRVVAIVFVVFLAGWNLRSVQEWRVFTERDHRNLQKVGESLAGLDGAMFVTASGVLPYASGWRSMDKLGLNSEEIAHDGVSRELLHGFSPDLVMVRSARSGKYTPRARMHDRETLLEVNEYLVEAGFVAITAVRTGIGTNYLYFARRDSALFDEIVERLVGIEGLPYVNVAEIMRERRIPVHRSGAPVVDGTR